jgi:hypothetical protein
VGVGAFTLQICPPSAPTAAPTIIPTPLDECVEVDAVAGDDYRIDEATVAFYNGSIATIVTGADVDAVLIDIESSDELDRQTLD